ncbi:hypothetical protein MOQ_008612 [Trypanosoma cruzi marinkellei]|uniref:Uncharacterized protein n=1 Tax=Trypanosoma cruzi marinkellei TaxID=85056 RepID=K2MKI4_TRYCR|nr:hypothetical protein MOQ_008612 [Trypanosoma cruzi marinkellei]
MRSCQRQNVRRREIIVTCVFFSLLLVIFNSVYMVMDVGLSPHDVMEERLSPKRPPAYVNSTTRNITKREEEEEEEAASSSIMVRGETISDAAVRRHFLQEVLLNCGDKWAAAGGINYIVAKELRRRRLASLLGANASPNFSTWWSYDDFIRDTFNPRLCVDKRNQKQKKENIILTHACDPVSTPPFNDTHDAACIHMVKLLLTAAVASPDQQTSSNVTEPPVGWQIFIPLPRAAERYVSWDRTKNMSFNTNKSKYVDLSSLLVGVQLDVLVPFIDQRTIKFRSKLCFCLEVKRLPDCLARMAFIVKVPQWQFNTDPFAEVAAFEVDRKLRMRRVPPTFLFPIPLAILQMAVKQRSQRYINMPNLFVRGPETNTYEKWVQNDVFLFLKKHAERGGEVYTRRGGLDAWCSFQIKIPNVTPLLNSPLRVPYGKKKKPGWHQWFNPLCKEVDVPYATLAALSEQVMFDYILGNDDRSPNKNSFVANGCYQRGCLRDNVICSESNSNSNVNGFPTIVHFDHGMAFRKGHASLENNPLAKPKGRLTFCMFYKPLLWRLWSIEKQLMKRHAKAISGLDWSPCAEKVGVVNTKKLWTNFLMANISRIVSRAVGKKAFEASGERIVRLLQRANECLATYPLEVVFLP